MSNNSDNIKAIPPLEKLYDKTDVTSTGEDSLISLACALNQLALRAIEMNIMLEKMLRSV
ncbi:MAG: hypothetical protein MJK14_28200 [Rivularia sp. ALOHA_DT_140]|nr:hypothetical protein [Rivularia sp. ALOHA_DT_140]